MPHWRSMMDSEWLRACDLAGREPTVIISKVVGGQVVGEGGKKSKKPILFFKGKDKPLAIGATIGKTIQGLYGPKTEDWIGKAVTLYATTTNSTGGETVECIRVRNVVPNAARASTSAPVKTETPPTAGFLVDREPGGDDGYDDDAARAAAAPGAGEMP